MAGDGAVRPVLQRLAAELGIARRVDFLGHIGRPELLRHLERVRAVIVMSRMDTSPNVVTEAHAAGLPVLGTRAGGISEMVEEGRDGFLVKVDDVTALAGHMDRLLEDAPLCARLGENGRAKVRELNDSARIAEAHASFFHALKARFDGLS